MAIKQFGVNPLLFQCYQFVSSFALNFFYMPSSQAVNPIPRLNDDTGFGTIGNVNGGRFINRNGTYNLHKKGWPFWQRFSLYYTMITMPLWQFVILILVFFIVVNLLYTGIYLLMGAHQFTGMLSQTKMQVIQELYFFSTETFTTVGYGRVNPVGFGANLVASFEAMTGFISFALLTGLMYGRFARPRAHLAFSDHAIIGPYRGGTALMFRFACFKENHSLTDVTVQVNLALLIQDNGEAKYKYYDLKLERSKIENMPMNWTVVHPIDEDSPLKEFAEEDLRTTDTEVYVLVRGFNDVYSSTVLQRTSYTYNEIRFNRKFIPMYQETEHGTVLELQKLHKSVSQS